MFRALALGSVVSAVCMCPLARADDAEDKAVAFVITLGGKVTHDEFKAGPVTIVNLDHTRVTDAGLKELASLEGLTLLRLERTGVTGEGLKEIRKALPKCEITK